MRSWVRRMALTLASMAIVALSANERVLGGTDEYVDTALTAAALVERSAPAVLDDATPTPVTLVANDGEYVYDIPFDQPLAVEVIEATQTRDGARVEYIVFVRDGAGFAKLGPYTFDATEGVFAGAAVDDELFLAGAAE